MELRHYLRLVMRSWLVILAFLVVGGGVGIALSLIQKPVYQSNTQIFVSLSAAAADTQLGSGNAFTQDRVQSYVDLATSPAVTGPVISDLDLQLKQSALADLIVASAPSDRVIISLGVRNHDPALAQRLATAVTSQLITTVQDKEQKVQPVNDSGAPVGDPQSVVSLAQVYAPTFPTAPISPRKDLNLGLGLGIGLLLGIGLVVLRDVLDNTLKSPETIAKLGVPLLGAVPMDKRASRSVIAFRSDPHSGRSEAYRALRTNLQFVDIDNPPHLIAVTSAMPGDGKTTTSINLAVALAEAGYRVCLIDADLRRPSVAKTLGLVGDVGFTSVLIGEVEVEEVLQNAGRNLAVLTSGPVPPNPSELLISDHARSIITEIAEKVDYTVVDTPPLLAVTDGAELSTVVDATLMVARANKTTVDQVKRAVTALANVGQKPVGLILNMVTGKSSGGDYEYGYYHYTSYRPDRRSRSEESEVTAADAAAGGDSARERLDAVSEVDVVSSTDGAVAADSAEAEELQPADVGRKSS